MNAGRVRRTPDWSGKYAAALNAILGLALAFSVWAPGAEAQEPPSAPWWGVDQVDRAEQPKNVPTWETHSRPGFADIATKPGDVIPSRLLVVKHDGSVVGMTLDEAFDRNGNDNRADDVWVVGWSA